MSKLNMLESENKLTRSEVEYWSAVFNSNLMVASEIEMEYLDEYYEEMEDEIEQSGGVRAFGNGIESIKGDGSLDYGTEMTTSPRRIYSFKQLYSGFKYIIGQIMPYEPTINERASWHNHVSLSNIENVKAQETNVPDIIFVNTFALMRKFAPALMFMTSTLPEQRGAYTRYDVYNRKDRAKTHTNDLNRMSDIVRHYGNTRYNMFNPDRMSNSRFHYELRFSDAMCFPVPMATLQIIFKAIVLKAIELSQFGQLDCTMSKEEFVLFNFKNQLEETEDDDEYFEEGWDNQDRRLSAPLKKEYIEQLKVLSSEFIDIIEDKIFLIDPHAVPFAKELAVKPVSLLFRELCTDEIEAVNAYYDAEVESMYKEEDNSLEEVEKFIALGTLKAPTQKEWKEKANSQVACAIGIDNAIKAISKRRSIKFINGRYIFDNIKNV